MKTKTIWITGASGGIGEALALLYASGGHNLILSARRQTELQRVAEACHALGGKCLVLPLDLADLKNPEALVQKALNFTQRLDILINNGGITQRGLAAETSMEVVRQIMEVNFFGQVALTNAVLPHLIKNGGGQIVVLSSLTGKFGFGLRSTYAASKHALHGYFESLSIENYRNNIHVTMVCPGRILTNISVNALNADGTNYGLMDAGQKNGIDSKVCAMRIIEAVEKRKHEVIIGKTDKYLVKIKRFFPSLFFKIAIRLDPKK